MTQKINKKGRSTGQLKSNKRLAIASQFVWHTLDMLDSPAWRVLSQSARRILDRIEIEHMRHGGVENGSLPVTFDDFQRYGVHRHAIAPAIRELEILGFIEITQRGGGGNAEFRKPNKFRLTYLHKYQHKEKATNEWSQVETMEDAEMKARMARNPRVKKQNSSVGIRTVFGDGIRTKKADSFSTESDTPCSVRNPPLLSISPGGEALREWGTPTLTDITPKPKRVSARLTAKQYKALSGQFH
jgi:hypothetical protein